MSNDKINLKCHFQLLNSPFVMDLDGVLCCFVCFEAYMFLACGVEASAAGA